HCLSISYTPKPRKLPVDFLTPFSLFLRLRYFFPLSPWGRGDGGEGLHLPVPAHPGPSPPRGEGEGAGYSGPTGPVGTMKVQPSSRPRKLPRMRRGIYRPVSICSQAWNSPSSVSPET